MWMQPYVAIQLIPPTTLCPAEAEWFESIHQRQLLHPHHLGAPWTKERKGREFEKTCEKSSQSCVFVPRKAIGFGFSHLFPIFPKNILHDVDSQIDIAGVEMCRIDISITRYYSCHVITMAWISHGSPRCGQGDSCLAATGPGRKTWENIWENMLGFHWISWRTMGD